MSSNPFQEAQVQTPQPQQQMPPQSQYQVPVEIVALPSSGKIYPVGHPLCNEQSVEIKAMTAKEEDILTSRALLKNGTLLTQLLKSCILNKTVDPDEMLIGDRNAILVGIRVTGYGADYAVTVTCPACGQDFLNHFSLAGLKLKNLTATPLQPNTNLFEFTLPSSGQTVHFKLLSGKDEVEVAKIMESKKKLGNPVEAGITTRLFQSVVSINGETERNKVKYLVENMRALDSRALRKYIDEVEPGVDMTQKILCTSCDTQSEVVMPLGMSFFWPDLSK